MRSLRLTEEGIHPGLHGAPKPRSVSIMISSSVPEVSTESLQGAGRGAAHGEVVEKSSGRVLCPYRAHRLGWRRSVNRERAWQIQENKGGSVAGAQGVI